MKLIDAIIQSHAEIQAIRRDIHAHPELCYEEDRTADLVVSKLTEWDIPFVRGLGKTGVVGIIQRGSSQRAIGLRADMDALPMPESNTFAHASTYAGKMHGCGHDGHTAMLLGAAKYLSKHRHFDGTVYLIFQPAEEGGAGAKRMIEDGLFEKCPMDAVFGMHNFPGLATGAFAVKSGAMMASSNEIELTITGKGSHASQPQNSIDPVMVAVQIAQSWQTVITRNRNPIDPAVLSITQIHAGTAINVIPDEAKLIGTVRTFSMETTDLIEHRMREIALHTAAAFGATIEFTFHRNYPPLVNHAKETAFAIEVMRAMSGDDNVNAAFEPTLGSEDFAFMLQHKPGCYVILGNGSGDHRASGHGLGPCHLHNGSYDFNDELLSIGSSYWVRLTEAYLKPTT